MTVHSPKITVTLLAIMTGGFGVPVSGQISSGSPQSVVGTIVNLDSSRGTMRIKNDRGQEVLVALPPSVSFRRVAPGESDLKNASTITLSDIATGDRVLARGSASLESLTATLIVVMSQTDVATRQAAESLDWDTRGISGLVTATGADSLTAKIRGASGSRSIVIALANGGKVRRYAPDSVRFTDAKPSSLDQIHIGDQVRARGDKSEDGSRILAVEIVAGTFKTIAGLILDINPAKSEIRMRDLDSKLPVIVDVNSDSKMQKIPTQAAQQLIARLRPGRGAAGPAAQGNDPQQVLDRSPAITLADLKVGDAIVVSSTVGSTAGQITAISLMAGVEPILTKPGGQEMSIGSWNLSIEGP